MKCWPQHQLLVDVDALRLSTIRKAECMYTSLAGKPALCRCTQLNIDIERMRSNLSDEHRHDCIDSVDQ